MAAVAGPDVDESSAPACLCFWSRANPSTTSGNSLRATTHHPRWTATSTGKRCQPLHWRGLVARALSGRRLKSEDNIASLSPGDLLVWAVSTSGNPNTRQTPHRRQSIISIFAFRDLWQSGSLAVRALSGHRFEDNLSFIGMFPCSLLLGIYPCSVLPIAQGASQTPPRKQHLFHLQLSLFSTSDNPGKPLSGRCPDDGPDGHPPPAARVPECFGDSLDGQLAGHTAPPGQRTCPRLGPEGKKKEGERETAAHCCTARDTLRWLQQWLHGCHAQMSRRVAILACSAAIRASQPTPHPLFSAAALPSSPQPLTAGAPDRTAPGVGSETPTRLSYDARAKHCASSAADELDMPPYQVHVLI